jgi:4-carboxymuconolactone decarboxylase
MSYCRNLLTSMVITGLASVPLSAMSGVDGPAGGRLAEPRVAPMSEVDGRAAQDFFLPPGTEGAAGRVVNVGDPPALNIFRTLAHHPDLLRAWTGFASYMIGASTLPARHREMAMLRIGWLCQSDYEFGQHARIAREVGMTDAEILAITVGANDPAWSEFERHLLTGVDELHQDAFVSDATWLALSKDYSVHQLMDFVFTVGQYNLVSMALNSLGVEREPGVAGFPKAP